MMFTPSPALVRLGTDALDGGLEASGPSATATSCRSWGVKDVRVDLAEPSSSSSRRIGRDHECRACSGVSSSRLRSEPTLASTLITTASRIESIGGFVTWANSCLKYE